MKHINKNNLLLPPAQGNNIKNLDPSVSTQQTINHRLFDSLDIFWEVAKYQPLKMRSLSKCFPDPIINSDKIRVVVYSVDLSDPENKKMAFAQEKNLKIEIKDIKTAANVQNLVMYELYFKYIESIQFDKIVPLITNNIQRILDLAQNLISFSCKGIEDNVTLSFPKELKFFACEGPMKRNVTIKFYENLISFSCGSFWDFTLLKLPESLKFFSCLVIVQDTNLTLPKNLISFNCDYIGSNSFSTNYRIKVHQNVNLTFGEKLIFFTCRYIAHGVTLNFPAALPELSVIAFQEIEDETTEEIFKNLQTRIQSHELIQ